MKTFTIEWNAVMTLEHEGRLGREALLELISLHGKKIDLGIVTTAASENTRLKEMPSTALDFDQRLETNGIGHLTKVMTIGVFDLTYYDYSIYATAEAKAVISKLWGIIKPTGIPIDHLEYAKQTGIASGELITSSAYSRWRNKWCDVYSLQAHINAGRDVYMSGDVKNFRGDKRGRLVELGIGHICGYDEALEIAGSL